MADYISREAVTTLFARACGECKEACEEFDGFYADCNQCLLHGVLKEFAAIPAADVRPVVRGKWEKCRGGDMCICSACYKYYIAVDEQYDYHFCPNCGADMKEASDGKD